MPASPHAIQPIPELFVTITLTAWHQQVKRATNLFQTFSTEQLELEIAPGRNRALYLFGHLIAANDGMLPLFGLGERLYPQLETLFLRTPDRSETAYPSGETLKIYWAEVHTHLEAQFNEMEPATWFQRHTAMTNEDWQKEPHRNKLSVLLSRTSHISYHLGQLAMIRL